MLPVKSFFKAAYRFFGIGGHVTCGDEDGEIIPRFAGHFLIDAQRAASPGT